MNERLAIGQGSGVDYTELLKLARQTELETGPAIKDANVREHLADWYVETQGLKYTKFRTLTALSKGETPGPESSIGKIVSGPKMQDLASFAMDLQGQGGILQGDQDAEMNAAFQNQWMWGAGYRIAGGTDEILRNIVSEQVLGLPQDIRVDKKVPFNELPGSGRK
jgi:alkylation response protein AidB-like acyl-CoA dehydrogenase